jgi:hypothetical protein
LRWGGGIGADSSPNAATFVQATEAIDIFDNRGQTVLANLFLDPLRIEAEWLPANRFQVVVP